MQKLMNKDDQDLRSVFVETGLSDQANKFDLDGEQPTTESDQRVDNYDVKDLLKVCFAVVSNFSL